MPHSMRGLLARRRADERGSLAPAVPIIAFMLLLLGGLGIDGSRQLNARGEATAYAEEAARAGAQAVDVNADDLELEDGPTYGPTRQRVADYCAELVRQQSEIQSCEFKRVEPVSATDPRPLVVVTEVHLQINTSLLGMIGKQTLSSSAEARARPYEGIDAPDE